ncbi:MAG TPA: GNAT family N-acetyltransferase [Kofleriaceae bacterium]|jgi:RimJ/RimL family protein N-acetyltransferase|nr:GNAT family N-acetyltransferase [Kofleriaceae bacterium]
MMRAPERIETERLVLRRPVLDDAAAILRYAGDPESTRFIGFGRHRTEDDARRFVVYSDREWDKGSGPFLIVRDGVVLGSTGLHVETPFRGSTGYLLAPSAWGHGYATEAVLAIVGLSRAMGHVRLGATVHPDNPASMRVLQKAGFEREGLLRRHTLLPNLAARPQDVWMYARVFDA